jgi:hypothetical protein
LSLNAPDGYIFIYSTGFSSILILVRFAIPVSVGSK